MKSNSKKENNNKQIKSYWFIPIIIFFVLISCLSILFILKGCNNNKEDNKKDNITSININIDNLYNNLISIGEYKLDIDYERSLEEFKSIDYLVSVIEKTDNSLEVVGINKTFDLIGVFDISKQDLTNIDALLEYISKDTFIIEDIYNLDILGIYYTNSLSIKSIDTLVNERILSNQNIDKIVNISSNESISMSYKDNLGNIKVISNYLYASNNLNECTYVIEDKNSVIYKLIDQKILNK